MNIQTTHVGSLPFTDLKEALAYTFQYDLPVLFTLPSLGKEHFMGADLCYQLGILNSINPKGGLEINEGESFKPITPFFSKEFFNAKGNREFKYQIIGPYTLSKMLSNNQLTLKQLSEKLIPSIKALIHNLGQDGLTLFSFDEPLIYQANTEELKIVKDFITELTSDGVHFSVHICSDIPIETCQKLGVALNLDISILKSGYQAYLPYINVIGLNEGILNLQEFVGTNSSKYLGNIYISPACGLYGRATDFCHRILNNLRESKEKCIAAKI